MSKRFHMTLRIIFYRFLPGKRVNTASRSLMIMRN